MFLAAGGPHPSRTTIETVKDVRCPLVIVATKDEPDMVCFSKREKMKRGKNNEVRLEYTKKA